MSLPGSELKRLLNFTEKLAIDAGRILSEGFHKPKRVRYKGVIDPVTQFDVKSENFIKSKILKRYPDHSFLAEEGDAIDSGSEFRWVIDPLDGTVNYAHGFPVYSVSIGLQYRGESVVGVVYDPEADEKFAASLGHGAFMNKKRLRVTSEKSLQKALLATGFAYSIRTARVNNLGMFARMAKKAQGVRRLGSAALDLCWLGAGRLDGFWEYELHPWDTAAATLIVTEAGGKVTRINGGSYSIFNKDILASNGHIHNAMKRVLHQRRK
jgi:myo-inositol-1(or 4)-monophosphatase